MPVITGIFIFTATKSLFKVQSVMQKKHDLIALILQTVLVVLLTLLGYLVTPLLFAMLPQKVAGDIAGDLFNIAAVITIVGLILLPASSCLRKESLRQRWHWLLSLIIMVVLYLGIAPWMADIKLAYPGGVSKESADWTLFASLHGIYQLGYLLVIGLLIYGGYKSFFEVLKINKD